jgi:hypothetical protein
MSTWRDREAARVEGTRRARREFIFSLSRVHVVKRYDDTATCVHDHHSRLHAIRALAVSENFFSSGGIGTARILPPRERPRDVGSRKSYAGCSVQGAS